MTLNGKMWKALVSITLLYTTDIDSTAVLGPGQISGVSGDVDENVKDTLEIVVTTDGGHKGKRKGYVHGHIGSR